VSPPGVAEDDLGALADQAGGPAEALVIVGIYLEHLTRRRDAVLGAGDSRALAEAAHALRSPSMLVGARELAGICARVERRALRGLRVPGWDLAALGRECERVRAALARLVADASG